MYPVPPHCPHCVCRGPVADVLVLATVEVCGADVAGADVGAAEVDTGALPAEPPCPGNGPAILVVIGPDSMNIPDQNQSSGAGSVPPFGSLSSPTCQSAEFVEVDAVLGPTT